MKKAIGNSACHHWVRVEPSQLDYVCWDMPSRYDPICRLSDSSATRSYHSIVLFKFSGKYRVEYNDQVRAYLCLPTSIGMATGEGEGYHVYTDGAF